jgi:hypothetical protein
MILVNGPNLPLPSDGSPRQAKVGQRSEWAVILPESENMEPENIYPASGRGLIVVQERWRPDKSTRLVDVSVSAIRSSNE